MSRKGTVPFRAFWPLPGRRRREPVRFPKLRRRATCYHGSMEAIVLVCCLAGLAVVPWEHLLLVALLVSVVAAAAAEVLPGRWAALPPLALALAALALPSFALFLPLAV